MDVKIQSTVSSKSQTLKVVDLFDISNATKYMLLNVYGGGTSNGTLFANSKAVPFVKFYPTMSSKTIVFELQNGVYTNTKYGDLSKVTFKTSATPGTLNVITMSTVNKIDPSFYSDSMLSSINALTNKITPIEYSSAVLTGGSVSEASVSNLIKVANSYVGKYWDMRNPWDLVQSMVAQIGTSLPISSIGQTSDAISNGNWVLKFNGNKPFGDWKTMLNPGDIIMMTSPDLLTDSVAVVTSGSNENALVINTAVKASNKSGNIVKILPEHLLSTEDVYDLATPANVFIYSLKNSSYTSTPISSGTTVSPYIISNKATVTPNEPYIVKNTYTQIYVTPNPDLKFGLNETFSIPVAGIFKLQNQNQHIAISISGIPSWAKFSPYTGLLTGRTPNSATTAHLAIKGTIGSATATDFMDIIVDRNKLVDISDTIWKAGFSNTISIDKGVKEPYFFTSNSKLNLTWLHIDQAKGTLYGIPPLSQVGQSIDITVYQQANAQSVHDQVDSFYLNISQPIDLIGSPLVSQFV